MVANRYRRIVFWQNMPSHHQSPVIEELAGRLGYDVVWAVQTGGNERARQEMGWPEIQTGPARIVTAPSPELINEILRERREESLHVFGGVFLNPMVKAAFRAARELGADCALQTEPPMPAEYGEGSGMRKLLRRAIPIVHRIFANQHGAAIKAVFCVGHGAIDWYSGLGISEEKLFSWAYFPPRPDRLPDVERGEEFRLIYAGSMNRRKGPDVLLQACLRLDGNWKLICIGEGELEDHCRNIASSHGLQERIEFRRFAPWIQVMEEIHASDLVIIPSRHDGWGAVTNESLSCGVPCVVTSGCGSADLLEDSWRGTVVPPGDPIALSRAIQGQIDQGRLGDARREKIREWWEECLSGTAGSDYFHAAVQSLAGEVEKPRAPWQKSQTQS